MTVIAQHGGFFSAVNGNAKYDGNFFAVSHYGGNFSAVNGNAKYDGNPADYRDRPARR